MKKFILFCISVISLFTLACFGGESSTSPDNPVVIKLMHVYGNDITSPFREGIDIFNQTEGKKKGIIIEEIGAPASEVMDILIARAAKKEPGAGEVPDLFTSYPRILQQIPPSTFLDWNHYIPQQEIKSIDPAFLKNCTVNKRLIRIPVAKSSELLILNDTAFSQFAKETKTSYKDLETTESLFDVCNRYYRWSGGKNFLQYNGYYNYFLVNIASLGGTFIKDGHADCMSPEFRKVYMTLAKAAIKGGISLGSGYASDRWKTGEIISGIGSTAGIQYLREYIVDRENNKKPIFIKCLPYPVFKNGKKLSVLRGTDFFAVKSSDERKNIAMGVFVEWLLQEKQQDEIFPQMGYIPVNKTVLHNLEQNSSSISNRKLRSLYVPWMVMRKTYEDCPPADNYNSAFVTFHNFNRDVRENLLEARKNYLEQKGSGDDDRLILRLATNSLQRLQTITGQKK